MIPDTWSSASSSEHDDKDPMRAVVAHACVCIDPNCNDEACVSIKRVHLKHKKIGCSGCALCRAFSLGSLVIQQKQREAEREMAFKLF